MLSLVGNPASTHPFLFKGPVVQLAFGCELCTLWVCMLLSLRAVLWCCHTCSCTMSRFFVYFVYHSMQSCSMAYLTNLKGYVRKLITLQKRKRKRKRKFSLKFVCISFDHFHISFIIFASSSAFNRGE